MLAEPRLKIIGLRTICVCSKFSSKQLRLALPYRLFQVGKKVRQKSSLIKFFAAFSATVQNFNLTFHRFIDRNLLHL